MKKQLLTVLAMVGAMAFFSPLALSHSDIKPQHGGVVHSKYDLSFELVRAVDSVSLYVDDHGEPFATDRRTDFDLILRHTGGDGSAAMTAVTSGMTAAITLACPGPAPLWSGDVPGQPLAPRPTGDFVFNAPSSMLFAPVVTMPLMSVGGMPVGLQLMGQQHEDARMTGLARWFDETLKRVSA